MIDIGEMMMMMMTGLQTTTNNVKMNRVDDSMSTYSMVYVSRDNPSKEWSQHIQLPFIDPPSDCSILPLIW